MSRRKPVEIAEDLATELLGPGAAISIDHEGQWTYARAWDAKGVCVHEVSTLGARRDEAARQLSDLLRRSARGAA